MGKKTRIIKLLRLLYRWKNITFEVMVSTLNMGTQKYLKHWED
jgi:hypothetical protein